MKTTIELDNRVEDLLNVRDVITGLREQLDTAIEREAQAKHDILDMDWPEPTLKYEDVTLSRVTTRDIKITEPTKVITWLKRNKYKITDFMKLDILKTKPVLKSAIYTEGKTIQGTESETRQTLRVTEN